MVSTTFTCTRYSMASMDDMDSDVGDESSSMDQNPTKKKNFYGDAAKYWEVISI